MGSCCNSRKSQNEGEKKIQSILSSFKLNDMVFKDVYKLIYQEDYDKSKKSPSDPNKKIKKYEFSQIAESHFYEINNSSSKFSLYHKDFFELVPSKLCGDNDNEIPCYIAMFLVFSFLKDTNSEKMIYFNYLTDHKITCNKEILNNIEFIGVIREYLKINLSVMTSITCSIINLYDQDEELTEKLELIKKLASDQKNLDLFVDEEFEINTQGERLLTMDKLRLNNYIFNFYELRSQFLGRLLDK